MMIFTIATLWLYANHREEEYQGRFLMWGAVAALLASGVQPLMGKDTTWVQSIQMHLPPSIIIAMLGSTITSRILVSRSDRAGGALQTPFSMYRVVFYPSSALTDTSRASASFASKGKSSAGISQQKTTMKKFVMCGDHGLQRLAGNAPSSLQSATAYRKRLMIARSSTKTPLFWNTPGKSLAH